MSKIYIPSDFVDSPCIIQNNGYMRAYTNNQLTNYVDIYYQNNYALKEGTSYQGYNGVCDTINEYTDDFYYRNDFDNILIGFSILSIFIIFIPLKIFSKLFIKRW